MAPLPPHVEETLQSLAELHLAHKKQTSHVERLIARITRVVCSPLFMVSIIVGLVVWVLIDSVIYPHLSTNKFGGIALSDAGTVLSICITLSVLVAQRRGNELIEHRDNLTLQLALLGEKKSAKIIELLESMRRENPALADRYDYEAVQMANPADTSALADAIRSARTDTAIEAL